MIRPGLQAQRTRGAAAVEYVLIMAFVVLPLGLMLGVYMKMIALYTARCVSEMQWPFP
jgi:hypothetical protein